MTGLESRAEMRSNAAMLPRFASLVACVGVVSCVASAPETIHFEGDVPEGPDTYFFLEFVVPEGIEEVEVEHSHVPAQTSNILDWGMSDPNGTRGSGGGNLENAIVGVEAASRSYIPGPMPVGTWRVTVGKAKIVPGEPAGYSVDVTLRTSPTLEPQPRAPYEDPDVLNTEARWYAGDFHVHTRESGDARDTLTIDEALDFAETQGLDFVLLAEHNTISGFTLYEDAQARHPNLLIIPGQEFTTYGGHGNAIGATKSVPYTVGTDGYTIADAIEAFHEQDALFSINHPNFPLPDCIGCAWTLEVDPATIDAVEVQTANVPGLDFWEELIENGSHATAVAGSDDHRAGIDEGAFRTPTGTPTTLVYARELSVDAILDGILDGRTVVKAVGPDGPMIESSMTGERIGNTVFADTAVLGAVVTGGEGLMLQVIKNGSILQEVAISSDPFEHENTVNAPAEGEDRYRHQVVEGIRRQSLSSYIWLRKADSSSG
jgi:predicted metal-dependent phosphoesterase TrpH